MSPFAESDRYWMSPRQKNNPSRLLVQALLAQPHASAFAFALMRTLRQMFTFALLAGWGLVCVFPLYWVTIGSLKPVGAVANGPAYIPFVDFTPVLDSWRYILFDSGDDTLRRFANSLIIASGATAATVLAGGLAAFGLMRNRRSAAAEGRLFIAIFASRALPPIVTAIPLYILIGWLGAL